jgi:hypothetical protein
MGRGGVMMTFFAVVGMLASYIGVACLVSRSFRESVIAPPVVRPILYEVRVIDRNGRPVSTSRALSRLDAEEMSVEVIR